MSHFKILKQQNKSPKKGVRAEFVETETKLYYEEATKPHLISLKLTNESDV
jgi:hypothetical protein